MRLIERPYGRETQVLLRWAFRMFLGFGPYLHDSPLEVYASTHGRRSAKPQWLQQIR